MKAQPNDFAAFKRWLAVLATFGNGQSMEEATHAGRVLERFQQAEQGVIGRACACGGEGHAVRVVQACPSWPRESHVFCREHAALVDGYQALMTRLVAEATR